VDDPATEPQPNGCSSPFGNNPAFDYCGEASSFLNDCNAHDTCYQTCYGGDWPSGDKYQCDLIFSSNLSQVCEPLSGDCKTQCQWWADIYAGAVDLIGGNAWKNDQVQACAYCACQ